MWTPLFLCFIQHFEAFKLSILELGKVLIKKTSCTNFLLHKQVSLCEHHYSLLYKPFKPSFGFTALQDHFPHIKQSQTFRWSEYRIFQEKPPYLTRKKGFVSRLTRPEPEPTVVSWLWFGHSSLDSRADIIENCLCFIQLVLLYELKSCTYQNGVCNK